MRHSDLWWYQFNRAIEGALTAPEADRYADELCQLFASNGGRLAAAIDELEIDWRKAGRRFPDRNLLAEAAADRAAMRDGGPMDPPRGQVTVPGSGLEPVEPVEPVAEVAGKKKRGRPPGPVDPNRPKRIRPSRAKGAASTTAPASSAAPVVSAEPDEPDADAEPAILRWPEPARASSAARASRSDDAEPDRAAELEKRSRKFRKLAREVSALLEPIAPWERPLILGAVAGTLAALDAERRLDNQLAGRGLESPHARRGSEDPRARPDKFASLVVELGGLVAELEEMRGAS